MTITLSPKLTEIYSNLIIGTANYFGPYDRKLNAAEYFFPIAEKRDDDIEEEEEYVHNYEPPSKYRYVLPKEKRIRYRHIRANDLIIEYLKTKDIDTKRYYFICYEKPDVRDQSFFYDCLDLFYKTLDKSDNDSDFMKNFYVTISEKVLKSGTQYLNRNLGNMFDVNVPTTCSFTYVCENKNFSEEEVKNMLEEDYKIYIQSILDSNLKTFERNGRVYLNIPNYGRNYTNKFEKEILENIKERAFKILNSEDMWITLCCDFFVDLLKEIVSISAREILEYQSFLERWKLTD